MALTIGGIVEPDSTHAVDSPTDPVTISQTPGHPVSTGAVESPSGPVTTHFGPAGPEPTGAVENPGPITIRNPSVKVIRPPAKPEPTAATTAETATLESRREARVAERAAQPTDPDTGR